jgi:hypothetical protein
MPTRDYDIQGFDRIRINGAFEFNITRADTFKVSITSDRLKVIEVSRDGDTLRIGITWYTYLWWFLTWWSHPRASITLPELCELRITGASHGETGDFSTTHDFSAEMAGASGLRLGNINAGNVDFRLQGASNLEFKKAKGAKASLDIQGASRVELSGTAYDAVIDIRGASQGKLENFTVHNAKVKVAGASSAVVKADGRLDIDAMGASNVSWAGNPTMGDVRSSGASTLHKA